MPGPNPPFCVAQSERAMEESLRQTGLWAPGLDPHWVEKLGTGPSGPIGMRKTDANDA